MILKSCVFVVGAEISAGRRLLVIGDSLDPVQNLGKLRTGG